MMGRGLDRLQQVPAGNVIAIGGLGTAILKSATITSTSSCRPLAPMLFQVSCLPWVQADTVCTVLALQLCQHKGQVVVLAV